MFRSNKIHSCSILSHNNFFKEQMILLKPIAFCTFPCAVHHTQAIYSLLVLDLKQHFSTSSSRDRPLNVIYPVFSGNLLWVDSRFLIACFQALFELSFGSVIRLWSYFIILYILGFFRNNFSQVSVVLWVSFPENIADFTYNLLLWIPIFCGLCSLIWLLY